MYNKMILPIILALLVILSASQNLNAQPKDLIFELPIKSEVFTEGIDITSRWIKQRNYGLEIQTQNQDYEIMPSAEPLLPICQTGQVADLLPVSVGQTLSFDLEVLFYGYNLNITGPRKDHIYINPKFTITQAPLNSTYHFIDGKIKGNNRFVGLSQKGNKTTIVIGTNYDYDGVHITHQLQVENIPHIKCFDVDETVTLGGYPYAIVDCGIFTSDEQRILKYNEFYFVDLFTYQVVAGTKTSDVFHRFKDLQKRKIEAYVDPVTKSQYLWRIYLRDGVDPANRGQTYAEIFLVNDPRNPQLLDVIDHTYANQKNFQIADYQIYNGFVYILNYNNGIYRIQMDAAQRAITRSFFSIKLDCIAFRIDQLGNSDDLMLIVTNGNTAYQYDWDLLGQPTLVTKYNLMPFSKIQQIFVDYNFVVIQSVHNISNVMERRVWLFTRFTFSYTHAYGSFNVPYNESYIIQWQEHGNTLHVFTDKSTYNVKLYRPYIHINPVSAQMAGQTQEYLITANSTAQQGKYKTCQIKMKFIYLEQTNTTIMKNVQWQQKNYFVDAPDKWQLDLEWSFFGPNLTYDVYYDINSSILPRHYIDKQHEGYIQWPSEIIDPSKIVFFEMFTQINLVEQDKIDQVRGLIQTQESQKSFLVHYVVCQIDVLQQTSEHNLKCRTLHSQVFDDDKGIIKKCSHMFDPYERRIAIIFEKNPNTVEVFYIASQAIFSYGKVAYSGIHTDQISGMAINNGFLYCVSTYGKFVDIYRLIDVESRGPGPKPQPVFTIDTQVAKWFGIDYFAPVDVQASPKYKETIFIKTKTGVIICRVNRLAQPQFLVFVPVPTSRYDFQVTGDTIAIITETYLAMYRLQRPLRMGGTNYLLQKLEYKFNLKEYDQINGDQFFYVVSDQGIGVINPHMISTGVIYSQFAVQDKIQNIDAVTLEQHQLLFIHTKKGIRVTVLAKHPKLKLSWFPQQIDFKVNLTALNANKKSQPLNFVFNVIEHEDTQIKPTQLFKPDQIRKLGHIQTDQNSQYRSANLTLNDTDWFNNTILRFTLQCNGQNNSECREHLKNIHLKNHVRQEREVVAARAIYDLQATYGGIIAQQYQSLFKTYAHNDSIETMVTIPTSSRGQICTKLAVSGALEYIVSLCETGQQVNLYITTFSSFKPHTIGPVLSQAKAVNKAQVVQDVLMIVDNQDNPFVRAGGIYLYLLDTNPSDRVFNFLDYIDWEDLTNVQGNKGLAYISSAHLHKPSHKQDKFRLFITDANSGNIFVFTFIISGDRQEIIYLSRKIIQLSKLIPAEIQYPTPLKVYTISLTNYYVDETTNKTEYFFILTVANWHHMEIMVTLDKTDQITAFSLQKLFRRYFWDLQNYVRYRPGFFNDSYFAVPYLNHELGRQIIAVYQIPKQNPWAPQKSKQSPQPKLGVPLIPMIGAHWVRDAYEVSFAFSERIAHNLLFIDVDAYNITELSIHPNVTLDINNVSKAFNLSIVAHNGMSNFTFDIQVYLIPGGDDETVEIIWAIIMLIGLMMIIGLLIVWVRQNKKKRDQATAQGIKQSLITRDSGYQNAYINRSSVDDQSIRNTIDLRDQIDQPTNKTPTNMQKIKEEDGQEEQQERRQIYVPPASEKNAQQSQIRYNEENQDKASQGQGVKQEAQQ